MKVNKELVEPPEAVIIGEDVPLENQEEDMEEAEIEEAMATLKSIGTPYTTMSEDELREFAIELLEGL